MKLLHTSDWHLGRSLYGHKRCDEFISFPDWLVEIIEAEKVDVLLGGTLLIEFEGVAVEIEKGSPNLQEIQLA